MLKLLFWLIGFQLHFMLKVIINFDYDKFIFLRQNYFKQEQNLNKNTFKVLSYFIQE